MNNSLRLLLVVLSFPFLSYSQNRFTDSLKEVLEELLKRPESIARDTSVARISTTLAYRLKSDPQSALQHAKRAVDFYHKSNNIHGIASAAMAMGSIFRGNGELHHAVTFGLLAYTTGTLTGDTAIINDASNNLANAYMMLSNYPEALNYHFKALKIRETKNDKDRLANTYMNIGAVYAQKREWDKSIEFTKKSLVLREALGKERQIADCYSNIAVAYDQQKKYELAAPYHHKAIEVFTRVKDETGIANEYNNLALCYIYHEQYDSSLYYLQEAIRITRGVGDPIGLAGSLSNLGDVYYQKKNYQKAIETLNEAMQISSRAGHLAWLSFAYQSLAKVHQATGNYKEAFDNEVLFARIQDSISSDTKNQEIGRLEAQSEFEKQQAREEADHKIALEKQKTLAAAESKQKNLVLVFILSGLVMLSLFSILILKRYRFSQRQKKIIEDQKMEVESQKHLIEEKQKEIIDSINYARRIQSAILATEDNIREFFPESFLYYKPKDIVAGDFYFFDTTPSHLYYAAADCTGHGVPGALVSVVCSNALSRCIKEFNLSDPGAILNKTRELVIETFRKSGKDVKDGMDISLLVKSLATGEFHWAGANNPLVYIQDGVMKEIPANKQPIGFTENPEPFTSHALNVSSGDGLFLFTDGYADQFGGPKGKKFKYRQLRELLLASYESGIGKMKEKIDKAFTGWKGELEQVDDVCIIGVRI
jgi:serine phosphatase RsbU (regulator of sigma subunit)/Tfp pilus assembly protein PilF